MSSGAPSRRSVALDYLAEHNVLTLATSGSEGVWAAGLFYVNEGFTFWFLSTPTSRHSRNIASNPVISGTVHEDYDDWQAIKGVQFEGSVRRLEGSESHDALSRYRQKFPVVGIGAPRAIAEALGRIAWYEIAADRVFFVDNSIRFGHRDEIQLG